MRKVPSFETVIPGDVDGLESPHQSNDELEGMIQSQSEHQQDGDDNCVEQEGIE